MAKAELCPVCRGDGIAECTEKTCHGCNGKGWVEVGDNSLDPALVPYTPSEPWTIPGPYPYYPQYPWVTWRNTGTEYYITCIN